MKPKEVPREQLRLTRCREACPAGIDVPRYIRRIREGKFDEALAVIRERIPFPSVCGHACFSPCEAGCANRQFGDPIAIRALKRAAAEKGGDLWRRNLKLAPKTGKRVAVVGSGPSGLTAAYYLATLGHAVTVLEALEEPGGMLRFGIPKYRLPREVLDAEIEQIRQIGVVIETRRPVESVDQLFQQGFDAVYLACGAQKGAALGIPGDDLPGVIDGISFLRKVNRAQKLALNGTVAVIGGGNTAVDAARCAVRLGAREIFVVYRRSQAEMTAYQEEVTSAVFEGVTFLFLAAPVRVEPKSSRLELSMLRMELGKKDAGGRPAPIPVPNSEFRMTVDTVIAAVGQTPDLAESIGVKAGRDTKRIAVDPDTLSTGTNGLFAGGDLVSGPASIIEAIAHGRKAASSIDKFLGGPGQIDQPLAPVEESVVLEDGAAQQERISIPCIPLSDHPSSFRPIEIGLTKQMAMKEAARCRNCDARLYEVEVHTEGCKECGYCIEVCGLNVFEAGQKFNNRGYRPVFASRSKQCVGCMACFYACPDFSIEVVEKK
ncbi:MAG: FAD-dependent oxidoreductase [Candidatus Abyssobacteria bacterium SURF_5]|uniref:FAD-dependent oxidoreductase n=1 Tax=Abyssobacteria bacterium (strain SURF_5) TaxID=2093360 RepID=A0A3A4NYD1_ABYX5|nr:MAG: FAD-dependent oxidoreductase [Candidatus Abyssubacteria bacterium SURF_5]